MSAIGAFAEATAEGYRPRITPDGRLQAPASAPLALLAHLRAHKPELVAILSGRACRRCGEAIVDQGSRSWAPFADGTAAHLDCEERPRPDPLPRRLLGVTT